MQREIHKWLSHNLNKEMEIAVYGYYGYALLLFPTNSSDYLEYERFQLIDSIEHFINSGTLKAFTINSINSESWLNKDVSAADKALLQQQYNKYVEEEVVGFINKHCNGKVPILASGASLGAFQAANAFFRKPELYAGLIAISGTYELRQFTGDYFDDNCYYNSPVDFLSNLTDEKIIDKMHNKSIILASGQGPYENPEDAKNLSSILHSKGIIHWLDLWGHDIAHDWPTWRKMLPYYLDNINI